MSRIVVFGLDGRAIGEIIANCNRAWAINDTGQTTIDLPAEDIKSWMDFGKKILVYHAKLPIWAGVVDTPWKATLPVQLTIYNVGYLLHLRSPEKSQTITGTTASIIRMLLEQANSLENCGLCIGNVDDDARQTINFDRRNYWTQILELVRRSGMEIQFRPELDRSNQLMICVDIKKRLGVNTQFLFHDGANGNIEITDAKVDGEIWNRITGYGDQQNPVVGQAQVDTESVNRYMLRNKNIQVKSAFRSEIDNSATIELKKSVPRLILTVNALDVADTFRYLNLGNWVMVHASRLWLPGGVRGWYGPARIMAMAYDESTNRVGMTLESEYVAK